MIVDMKNVTTAMVKPRAGCSSFCQGAFSQATTQDGAIHEAMAANIMISAIESQTPLKVQYLLDTELIVRRTCGRVKEK